MTRRYQGGAAKDDTGILIQQPKLQEAPLDVSIDKAINDGLVCIRRIMDILLSHTTRNVMPPREDIASLKDCMAMLGDLKKQEDSLIKNISTEELKKLLDDNT